MIDRRVFLGTLAGGLVVGPHAADAQQAGKVARLGVLAAAPDASWEVFRRTLRNLGWIEGQNLRIEWRWTQRGAASVADLAAELVRLHVDVLLVASSTQVEAARQATTTIPIVFAFHADPVGLGHVASLARPGGNITGVSQVLTEVSPKMLEVLTEAVPGSKRVGVLWNPTMPSHALALKEIDGVAQKIGVRTVRIGARSREELDAAFASMVAGRVGAALVVPSPLAVAQRAQLVELSTRYRVAAMFGWREDAEAGGLMSYGIDRGDAVKRAAAFVDKILRGTKPADLPVEQATRLELVINLKTAKALGLKIPPWLLARADQVIE